MKQSSKFKDDPKKYITFLETYTRKLEETNEDLHLTLLAYRQCLFFELTKESDKIEAQRKKKYISCRTTNDKHVEKEDLECEEENLSMPPLAIPIELPSDLIHKINKKVDEEEKKKMKKKNESNMYA